MSGKIVIFSGYAGAGKNTNINKLLSEIRGLNYIPSVTTRSMREGESERKPYFFRDLRDLEELKQKGSFIESENIHGNWYGTLQDKYDEVLSKGEIIVKDIDVNGAMEFKKRYGNLVHLVFIRPSNDLEVIDRMRDRGDLEEEINKRKDRIKYESSYIKYFDDVVINDEIDVAVEKSKKIIRGIVNEESKGV